MSRHLQAFLFILALGVAAILAARIFLPGVKDALQRSTSDSASLKTTLRIGVDSWVGYFPLCSPEMDRRLRHAGYGLQCIDDKADAALRMQRLADGELELAVATVDSYLVTGSKHDFPGAVVAVLDESKGGDALLARRDRVTSLDAMRSKGDLKIAYTPASPSEHLLRAVAAHFDQPQLSGTGGSWRVEATGSEDAFARLNAGSVDAAVLWEPDVSRALADPKLLKLIGTEDTEGLIVDVLLASRTTLSEQPDALRALLEQYFATLHHYTEHPAQLQKDLQAATGVSAQQADAMLGGVQWATLNDNGATWFGITPSGLPGQERLIEVIRATVSLLAESGAIAENPLPAGDPYRITNRAQLGELYLASGGGTAGAENPLARDFSALDDAGWAKLRPVGTLKVEPIGFGRGTALLDADGRATLDRLAERLSHYPNFRILIGGHTGRRGDAQANLELSQARAAAVAEYLLATWRIDTDRVRAVGYGASRPLARAADESDRAFEYRLPRVEVALVGEAY